MEKKNCNLKYDEHICTLFYHQYSLGFYLTDGILDVAKNEKCFWFIDVIISAQIKKSVRKEDFQVWYLERQKNEEFVVFATNGNWVEDISEYDGLSREDNDCNIIYKQSIPFSDFAFDTFKVYVSTFDKVIYLPNEH